MSSDDFESRLRGTLSDMVEGVTPGDDLVTKVVRSHRIERRRRRAMCSAIVVASAAIVAFPVGFSTTQHVSPQAIVVHASSASFRYPSSFHADKRNDAKACSVVTFVSTNGHGDHEHIPTASDDDVRFLQRAVGTSGACLAVAFSFPYSTAGGATDPTIPDGATPVQIGSLNGFEQTVAEPGGPEAYLYVQLPERRGTQRDLVFGATGLTVDQLVSVVQGGLSS